jgi:hypothetical protein
MALTRNRSVLSRDGVTVDGFGIDKGFIEHFDTARDYPFQATVTHPHTHTHTHTSVHSHVSLAVAC